MSQDRRMPSIWDDPPPAPPVNASAFAGKNPNKVISVPHEYQRRTLSRESDTLINDIKVNTNCSVVPHWIQGKIVLFDIYGAGPGVEKAVRHINHWITNARNKSRESSAWAKMKAYNDETWRNEQVESMENERKQRFKGPVPPVGDPDAPTQVVAVDWPDVLDNDSTSPRDVFGNKLERLDTLRMQDNVWMTLAQNDIGKWQIKISGYAIFHVEAARDHLNTLLEQVYADTSSVEHACNLILDEREGIYVELQQHETWWPNHDSRVVPRLLSSTMMDDPGSFRDDGLPTTQLASIQTAIKLALDKVRGRKGVYDFSVRLGSLAFSSKHMSEDKIGQRFKKEAFLKDINGHIEMDVKKWLANEEIGRRILDCLISKDDILEPIMSGGYFGCVPASLSDTRPTLRGTWVFRDPNSAFPRQSGRSVPHSNTSHDKDDVAIPLAASFIVQVDWTEDEEGQYEKGPPRFYKLEAGKGSPKRNMNVNMLELGESRGWHFALESLASVPSKTVPAILVGFAAHVTVKPQYDVSSTNSFAQWEQTPTVRAHLQNGRLDKVYCFGIKDTGYKVEVTAMWFPRQNKPVWGLAVRHLEWASHLAELESLPIGRQAGWGDTTETFFPKDGHSSSSIEDSSSDLGMENLNLDDSVNEATTEGLELLIGKLLKLSEIVSSVTNEGGARV